jgi:hypothetical protein
VSSDDPKDADFVKIIPLQCPFCGEVGFNKLALKRHLLWFCEDYAEI